MASAVLAFCLCRTASAQAPARAFDPEQTLNAVLWVRTSVEYAAAAKQAYASARHALNRALDDPRWTAAVEQTGAFQKLPPAVVLDLDETVLDNGAYQAGLIEERKAFSDESWSKWVAEQRAGAVPGAVDFLTAARAKDVALFYITNRSCSANDAADPTVRMLRKLDVPLAPGALLCGSGDKTERRRAVARTHRIVEIIGDDLNDFMAAPATVAGRDEAARPYAAYWGERWFMVPNPMYGSWERAARRSLGRLDPLDRGGK